MPKRRTIVEHYNSAPPKPPQSVRYAPPVDDMVDTLRRVVNTLRNLAEEIEEVLKPPDDDY